MNKKKKQSYWILIPFLIHWILPLFMVGYYIFQVFSCGGISIEFKLFVMILALGIINYWTIKFWENFYKNEK